MSILLWIINFIVRTLIIILIADGLIMGIPFSVKLRRYDKAYLLKVRNRMAFQKSTECSGFSFAYVLRSFGIEADGNDIYVKIDRKMKNGAVMPRVLAKEIRKYGYKADYVKGNLDTLKADLSEGKRVIVLIRTKLDKKWLHYVPVVGYDEDHIYIAESMSSLINCENEYYNRKLTYRKFLKYWDTREIYMPFYRNTYIVIEQYNNQER